MILMILYSLASLVLIAIAIVVHMQISALSLPITPSLSISTVILPILSLLVGFTCSKIAGYTRLSEPQRQVTQTALQSLQGISITVLATLWFGTAAPSVGTDCSLEARWMSLFRAHDASTIKHIQNKFDCCGFNTVRDRAFPFPLQGPSECASVYGRSLACRAPWLGALRSRAKVEFAVVLAVGLMQVAGLFLMRQGVAARRTAPDGREHGLGGSWSQPLLGPPRDQEEEAEGNQDERGNSDVGNYGGTRIREVSEGPMMEPSGIHHGNEWS